MQVGRGCRKMMIDWLPLNFGTDALQSSQTFDDFLAMLFFLYHIATIQPPRGEHMCVINNKKNKRKIRYLESRLVDLSHSWCKHWQYTSTFLCCDFLVASSYIYMRSLSNVIGWGHLHRRQLPDCFCLPWMMMMIIHRSLHIWQYTCLVLSNY